MKRTPLKRQRDTPRRNEGRVVQQRMKRKRGDRTAMEARHIARVAQIPCLLTGQAAEVHHLLKAPGKRAGRDHRFVVPLSPEMHRTGWGALHALGSEAAFEETHGLALGHLIAWAIEQWAISEGME